ncbi:MAG TPA: HipA family kinase [Anoxybacillus sp.]|nr:HipA family kinase [Anoxybacillus sp.]
MSEPIYPIKYTKLQRGISSPFLVQLNNQSLYVVKFKNNPKGPRVLVNEFVAGELAKLLNLPVPSFKILPFPPPNSGHQFCSKYIPKAFGLPKNPPAKHLISNRKEIIGLILFDYWINNIDRHRNNILLKQNSNGMYHVYIIDHSHCFPGHHRWSIHSLRNGPQKLKSRSVHHWIASLLDDFSEFDECLEKIMNISKESLRKIISSIPQDWDVSHDERLALLNYLLRIQTKMPKIANYIKINYYSSHQ